MTKHFKRIKVCSNVNDIQITDEIKAAVLRDHVYHPPVKDSGIKVVNNNINHYNLLNNFIQGIDVDRKMQLLDDVDYMRHKRLSFEDTLDRDFELRNDKLANDTYRFPYIMSEDRLLDVIDTATKVDDQSFHRLNVIFDKAINKLKVWMGSEWEDYAEEKGITQIVSYAKSYYLDNYELYLIRKMHQDGQNGINPFEITEHLKIYYKFLVPFRLKPCIMDFKDREVLGHRLSETNDYVLADKYMAVFRSEEQSMRQAERNKSRREISKIIKGNSVHNITTLNNALFELIKVDEDFKTHVFGTLGVE